MADVKISGLPASTTPLTGTEVLPIVQGTTTKQVSVANLTAGRVASSAGYQVDSTAFVEVTTSRALASTDNGKILYSTAAGAVTITTTTALGAGFSCTILQYGAGKITVAQGASTTLLSYSSLFSTMGQYAVISLICPVANTFVAAGNLGV